MTIEFKIKFYNLFDLISIGLSLFHDSVCELAGLLKLTRINSFCCHINIH